MIKKIGLGLFVIIGLILGYAAMQSPDYRVSREITIHAPAEKIFPFLNSSKLAEQWGPWLETDPQAKMSYSGPDAGVGSRASWDSPDQLGTGSATIVESIPNKQVGIKLEYVKPMNMSQDSIYLIEPAGNQSLVRWTVTGKNSLLGRVMCIFVNMDKVVGGMFEKGLSNLKTVAEKSG
jgi:hypothetical protein